MTDIGGNDGALIVVLPGIGGTILARADRRGRARRDAAGRPMDVVWSARPRDAGVLVDTDRLRVSDDNPLAPVGLIRSWKPFPLFAAVHGYEKLLNACASAIPGARVDYGDRDEPDLTADVVAFGYDFRLGVERSAERLNAELVQRLDARWPGTPAEPAERRQFGRVIFVAHSMGGLVARYWTAAFGRGDTVRAIVTLGTPHRGAPKALDVVANGYPIWGGHLHVVRDVVAGWQGMADLLPTYPCIPTLGANAGGDSSLAGAPLLRRPHEAGLSWLDRTDLARNAFRMHDALKKGWRDLEAPPSVHPRIGFNRKTLRVVCRTGDEITVSPGTPDELPAVWANDRGDGTVPAYSALPVEMDNTTPHRMRVGHSHGSVVDLNVTDLLKEILGHEPPGQAFCDLDRPIVSLGMDCPEVWDGADRPDVAVSVWQHDKAGSRRLVDLAPETPVSLQMQDIDTGAPVGESTRLAWHGDSGEFQGEMPFVPVGVYLARVQARDVTDDPVEQLVEVIDADG